MVATKPLYAGKVTAKFKFTGTGTKVVTIRPKVFAPAAADQSASVTVQNLAAPAGYKSKVTSVQQKEAGAVDVKDADIIITGGRGVGGPEGFKPLREFAQALGAAVGASRAAVDAADRASADQSPAASLSPKLYIACGVSGLSTPRRSDTAHRAITATKALRSSMYRLRSRRPFEIVPVAAPILACRGKLRLRHCANIKP